MYLVVLVIYLREGEGFVGSGEYKWGGGGGGVISS